jgi:hypothetical protein
MSLPRVRSRWTRLRGTEAQELLDLRRWHGGLDEVPHEGAPALVVQRAGSDAFKGPLRHRRRLEKGAENLREPGIASSTRHDLAGERSGGGGHSRMLRQSGWIETIETQLLDRRGRRGSSHHPDCPRP